MCRAARFMIGEPSEDPQSPPPAPPERMGPGVSPVRGNQINHSFGGYRNAPFPTTLARAGGRGAPGGGGARSAPAPPAQRRT